MNVRQFLSAKKKILIPLFIILILMAGGFFYWWNYYETPPEKWSEADYSKAEDYVVRETPEGIIVENEKVGLSFKVLEGWRVEKSTFGRSGLSLYSQDAVEEKTVLMQSGCRITFETIYVKTDLETLRTTKQELSVFPVEKYKIIKVSNHEALKCNISDPELNLYGIDVSIPIRGFLEGGKLHFFILLANFDDKERCIQKFDEFLKTVSIE